MYTGQDVLGLIADSERTRRVSTATEDTATQQSQEQAAVSRQYYWGTGRRKRSVARVRVREGDGTFEVNGRPVEEYFPDLQWQREVRLPLQTADLVGKVDVFVNVRGGGLTGQAGAILMGLARALVAMRPDLHDAMREARYLTRDARKVERKKYGRRKARRSFQFSKR